MRKYLATALVAGLVSTGWSSLGVAAEWTAQAAPVDFRSCNFREGKTLADLEKTGSKLREYAKEHDLNYSAWILLPQYHTGADYDVGWLGAWPSGGAFGVSMERWIQEAVDLQEEFDKVIDCSARHEMAMSLPINAPEGTPEDGVLMFYACTVNDGKTVADAYKAHLEAGTMMKGRGSLAASWFFEPVMGAAIDHPDYYHVVGFYRYSDMGATMDLYMKGGRAAQQQILSKTSSCETPVAFDAISVRARDER
jgi:hypothetical protein